MKIKKGFVLRKFADKIVAVADNDTADYCNIFIKMNGTGEFVWNLLQNDVDYDFVISSLCNTYEVDEKTAKADFDEFLSIVRKAGLLNEQA